MDIDIASVRLCERIKFVKQVSNRKDLVEDRLEIEKKLLNL